MDDPQVPSNWKSSASAVAEAAGVLVRRLQAHPDRPTMAEAADWVMRVATEWAAGVFGEPDSDEALDLVMQQCTAGERAVCYLRNGFPPVVGELLDALNALDARRNGHLIEHHSHVVYNDADGTTRVVTSERTILAQQLRVAGAKDVREVDHTTGEIRDVVLFPYSDAGGVPHYRDDPSTRGWRPPGEPRNGGIVAVDGDDTEEWFKRRWERTGS